MIDIRFFRKGHFASAIADEGMQVLETEYSKTRSQKWGILFAVMLALILLVTSILFGEPFAPAVAWIIMALAVVLGTLNFIHLQKEDKQLAHVRTLPVSEQVELVIRDLRKPVSAWPWMLQLAFIMLISGRDFREGRLFAFTGDTAIGPRLIEIAVVALIAVIAGRWLARLHRHDRQNRITTLERWQEVHSQKSSA